MVQRDCDPTATEPLPPKVEILVPHVSGGCSYVDQTNRCVPPSTTCTLRQPPLIRVHTPPRGTTASIRSSSTATPSPTSTTSPSGWPRSTPSSSASRAGTAPSRRRRRPAQPTPRRAHPPSWYVSSRALYPLAHTQTHAHTYRLTHTPLQLHPAPARRLAPPRAPAAPRQLGRPPHADLHWLSAGHAG